MRNYKFIHPQYKKLIINKLMYFSCGIYKVIKQEDELAALFFLSYFQNYETKEILKIHNFTSTHGRI